MNPADRFNRVVRKLDPQSKLLRSWALPGGVSAQVMALEIERASGQRQTLVLRQHGTVDREHNPQIAADEFKLLRSLHAAGLPVPAPYYLDQSGDIFATPYLIVEYIAGTPADAPADRSSLTHQVATQLARIHQVDWRMLDLAFLPRHPGVCAPTPDSHRSADEQQIWDRLAALPPPAQNKLALLHGDMWPGNLLWRAEQLVAIIDWEDAALGEPLADVANTRLEILLAYGATAMRQFTDYYQALTPIDWTDLSYWDLCAALRLARHMDNWGLDAERLASMRAALRWFITQTALH